MNFEFTALQVLLYFVGITVIVVAIIYILKARLNSQKNLKEKYAGKTLSSPLEARNKYPEVDGFKLRDTILLVGLVLSLAAIFFAFNWTKYEKLLTFQDMILK
ncbi:MAG: hypothetical protein R2771_07010 [Saprospiraceae bacterium]